MGTAGTDEPQPPADAGDALAVQIDGGGESCYYVYLNGQFVGMSKDSRLPAEFDLTPHLRKTRNTLAIMCIRYGDASYLEDQDHWWMAGLYRSVKLYSTDHCYIEDVFARALLATDDYETGRLSVTTKINFDGRPGRPGRHHRPIRSETGSDGSRRGAA